MVDIVVLVVVDDDDDVDDDASEQCSGVTIGITSRTEDGRFPRDGGSEEGEPEAEILAALGASAARARIIPIAIAIESLASRSVIGKSGGDDDDDDDDGTSNG